MHSASKVFVTIMIWSCITGISIASLVTVGRDEPLFPLIICAIALITAAITTTKIWNTDTEATSEAEKIKRQSRVERMLKQMDDRDIEELRARLSEGDGETASLEDLLAQREQQFRR